MPIASITAGKSNPCILYPFKRNGRARTGNGACSFYLTALLKFEGKHTDSGQAKMRPCAGKFESYRPFPGCGFVSPPGNQQRKGNTSQLVKKSSCKGVKKGNLLKKSVIDSLKSKTPHYSRSPSSCPIQTPSLRKSSCDSGNAAARPLSPSPIPER
ncbi:hypothetical protein SAMN06265218_11437 [Fodinibius sediminis]|uniref:Uncharacterized protein n=1 Tax=Fodinibius sediminis TaxID=1214077 RepID=A0A521EAY5_9BACT|nr:hypothetical protein SAMN06265218_11437 [Fodinibius sediminis]